MVEFSKKVVEFAEVEIDLDAVQKSLSSQEEKDAARGVKVTVLAMTDWDELQIDFEVRGWQYIATFKEPHLGGISPEIISMRTAMPAKLPSVLPYLEAVRAACDI